jgi:uncharacterized protein YdaU (DUF1376 family)
MAKDKSPAFQFYPADWLASSSVSLMTPAEEGAYIRLLALEWLQNDCGLPDDDAQLASLSRLGKKWFSGSGAKLRRKFTPVNGRLFNDRLIEERQKQFEWKKRCSDGGKKGMESRYRGNKPDITTLQGTYDSLNKGPLTEPNSSSSSLFSSSSSKEESPLPPGGDDVRITTIPEWKTDPTFQPFVEAYRKTGAAVIDEDFVQAYFSWRVMDFEQKAKALNGIAERVEKGAWCDPAMIHNPKNYLKGEYKRPVLARAARSGPVDPIEAAKQLARERRTHA